LPERAPDKACYRYRADVLERLWAHGVQPTDRTSPELVREYVRELYKFEIRRLRARMMHGAFPREDYAAKVDTLRRCYPVLALRARDWTEPRP
jgi:hypothetical protein